MKNFAKSKIEAAIDAALEQAWLSGNVMSRDINTNDIMTLRYHMNESQVGVHLTDQEIICIWKSYIKSKLKD